MPTFETARHCPAAPVNALRSVAAQILRKDRMEDVVRIETRGDFGMWAIEAAKQIVSEHGFALASAARDGTEEEVRAAGNALGQAITDALMEVYDGLSDHGSE